MVVIYDLTTKQVIRTEDNTNIPILPFNMKLEEKEKYLKDNNQGYLIIENEIGANIYKHNLIFDDKGDFKELKLKEGYSGK